MGATTNPSRTNVRLGFLIVRQEWLRDAAKLYLKYWFCHYLLGEHMPDTGAVACVCFSNFLAEVKPQATAKDITRGLLLDYLNHLQKRSAPGMRQEQRSPICETSWRCRIREATGSQSDPND